MTKSPSKKPLTKPLLQPLNIEKDFALLMTATIDIQGMPKAYPTVPEQRQQDYINSLSYYIHFHPRIRKIIFVENSGWPLNKLKTVTQENPHKKDIEFISLDCNHFPRKLGKGYGESLLIEKGVKQSHLIENVTHFAKITGRIYLKNITQILETITQSYDCLCDYKDQGWRLKRLGGEKTAHPHCDTRFLVFRKEFYRDCIQPLHQKHREKTEDKIYFYVESQYYKAIRAGTKNHTIVSRFSVEPNFQGVAGHFGGKDYSSGSERVKYRIRGMMRKITPWLHL